MIHLGDITKINGANIPPVDVITGGSPCQDLSIAGLRKGMKYEANGDEETTRSGLFMDQIRIVKEMRANELRNGRSGVDVRPRYMVWENVPGAFSSNKGKDFQVVLSEIVRIAEPDAPDVPLPEKGKWSKSGCIYDELGKWSIAWRVHDAQFWGVPQRRKRISLVADFGGLSSPEVLFERKGLSGDFEQGKKAREKTSRTIGEGFDGTSWGIDHVITTGGNCTAKGPCVYEEVEASLKAGGPHAVFSAIAFGIDKAITTGGNCTAGGDCVHKEFVSPLMTDRPHGVISFQERGWKPGGGKGILVQYERTGALSTLNNQDERSAKFTKEKSIRMQIRQDIKHLETQLLSHSGSGFCGESLHSTKDLLHLGACLMESEASHYVGRDATEWEPLSGQAK